ncbi:MAG TPA: phosphotransferase [Firmicutes bacterium]|nr:phosphotransferase [Bacillota bacterium]
MDARPSLGPRKVDFHCHLLPGVDDGPDTLEKALAMAEVAVAEAITDVVATPHALHDTYSPAEEAVIQSFRSLQEAILRRNLPLRLHLAAEVTFRPDLVEVLTGQPSLTVRGERRYVLTELPFYSYPNYVAPVCFELLLHGIVPVLAHPERNTYLQEHPYLLYELVAQGVMTQVDAESLTGRFGEPVQNAALLFLRHGLTHLLGSDGHDPERRPPRLEAALRTIEAVAGREQARLIGCEWPSHVLAGEYVAAVEPIPIDSRGRPRSVRAGWRRFFFPQRPRATRPAR